MYYFLFKTLLMYSAITNVEAAPANNDFSIVTLGPKNYYTIPFDIKSGENYSIMMDIGLSWPGLVNSYYDFLLDWMSTGREECTNFKFFSVPCENTHNKNCVSISGSDADGHSGIVSWTSEPPYDIYLALCSDTITQPRCTKIENNVWQLFSPPNSPSNAFVICQQIQNNSQNCVAYNGRPEAEIFYLQKPTNVKKEAFSN